MVQGSKRHAAAKAVNKRATARHLVLLASSTAVLALHIAPAFAQSAPAEDQSTEIVVTASKRNESISNVGASISALSGERLSELGLNSFQDFTRLTPGVSFQSVTPGRTQISIRGVNVGTTQPSSSVATYLDEVPLTAAATSSLSGDINADPDPLENFDPLQVKGIWIGSKFSRGRKAPYTEQMRWVA